MFLFLYSSFLSSFYWKETSTGAVGNNLYFMFLYFKICLVTQFSHCWQIVIHALSSLDVSCFLFSTDLLYDLPYVLLDMLKRYEKIYWIIASEMFSKSLFSLLGLCCFLLVDAYYLHNVHNMLSSSAFTVLMSTSALIRIMFCIIV